jgi:hypothetical protein
MKQYNIQVCNYFFNDIAHNVMYGRVATARCSWRPQMTRKPSETQR